MKYKSEVFQTGGYRVRVSYQRRHWFFRWRLMGVEVWTPAIGPGGAYGYVVYKNHA